jgi:hypothetical protein
MTVSAVAATAKTPGEATLRRSSVGRVRKGFADPAPYRQTDWEGVQCTVRDLSGMAANFGRLQMEHSET